MNNVFELQHNKLHNLYGYYLFQYVPCFIQIFTSSVYLSITISIKYRFFNLFSTEVAKN